MRIEVAGAGAGKTSNMASRVLAENIPVGKVFFCVAFTNAAANNIRTKLAGPGGILPDNIKISTIHSFLYNEIVQPFYHLLFDKRYRGISVINLPNNGKRKSQRISDLEKDDLLHLTMIPQRAKWVVDKRSGDKVSIKSLRLKVLELFRSYCFKIVVDEAQDLDEDMMNVFLALDRFGIPIELFGDPKQDVKGHGCFRELMIMFSDNVIYRGECHRCPEPHLRLSNRLASKAEQQHADETTCAGSVNMYFESDIGSDIEEFIAENDYGLKYISKKSGRFKTHDDAGPTDELDSLRYELEVAIHQKQGNKLPELKIKRVAFLMARKMMALVVGGADPKEVIRRCIRSGLFDYDKKTYARIIGTLKFHEDSGSDGIVVKSIEAVKGLEHRRCLFILTNDLVPYLLGEKTEENKTKHLLYVALTRSLDNLTILVASNVETRYPRERILAALNADE